MQIPIENIYYLLCYAWGKLEEKDLVRIDPTDTTRLVDLFAKLLIEGVNHLLKRGFDRGYVRHSEETRRIRGRVSLAITIKRNLLKKGVVQCEYDELSYNVLHNRILKSTIRNLARGENLDPKLREQLVGHYHRLHEVDDIQLSQKVFSFVQLHRNNFFYDFLMRVCELLYMNLLPTERGGSWQFKNFLQDEVLMRGMFENFVRNFYKVEARGYKVGREDIYWRLTTNDAEAKKLLPDMQTDITLTTVDRKIIVECKYTAQIFQDHFGIPKFRSEHMYQLNAYLTNLPESETNRTCQGILLYPATTSGLNKEFSDAKGRSVTVRTINLNQVWQGIHHDLLAMVA
jgi:5-methylcytosine-specific restriction enzyme subunit McrC